MSTADTLAEEDQGRRWAAPAAALGGALPLGAIALQFAGRSDAPAPGNQIGFLPFVHAQSGLVIAGGVLQALSSLATVAALFYLLRATRARRPELPRIAAPLLIAGGVTLTLATIAVQIVLVDRAAKFVSQSPVTFQAARDILREGPVAGTQIAAALASVIQGAAIVIIALNAMRVGLLTRFMGYLGVFTGALLVLVLLQLTGKQPPIPGGGILQPFWLIALAVLFARRWPQGQPPAWESGQAEPWPTAQEMREQREASGGGKPSRGRAPEPEPVPQAAVAGPARPGAARRKRKKRR